jgi:hypothetical protein
MASQKASCTEKGNGWSVALPASKVCDGKSIIFQWHGVVLPILT